MILALYKLYVCMDMNEHFRYTSVLNRPSAEMEQTHKNTLVYEQATVVCSIFPTTVVHCNNH